MSLYYESKASSQLLLPKGRAYGMFERTDLRVVGKAIGDHIVIGGGISTAVVAFGSREKVIEEACKLLNDVKEPGGFMLMGGGGTSTTSNEN
uniref:Uncharacterized protein n=1 Tax=Ignisphaera aggregans TaxID=334771 RepID=A0A7C4FD35_9CREN